MANYSSLMLTVNECISRLCIKEKQKSNTLITQLTVLIVSIRGKNCH